MNCQTFSQNLCMQGKKKPPEGGQDQMLRAQTTNKYIHKIQTVQAANSSFRILLFEQKL